MDQRRSTERTYQHHHPQLNAIDGNQVTDNLIQFRSMHYAKTPRRFARSVILHQLPTCIGGQSTSYDATSYGPCSIQPQDSIETDVRWNQLPERQTREQDQVEDCLRLTVTCPLNTLNHASGKIPVIVFLHGGALMIGSGIFLSKGRFECSSAITSVYR